MYSSAARGVLGFLSNLAKPAQKAVAQRLLPGLLPSLEMSGNRALQTAGRRAAVNAGLTDELTAFPSVVSQRGMQQGLMGIRQPVPASAPSPSSLNPIFRGLTGAADESALSPELQQIVNRARQAQTAPAPAPGVRGVPALAQNRVVTPLQEAPQPPVRYPGPAPASETARQVTMLKPGPGEVGSMGSRLTYRPGTEGLTGRLGSTTYGEGAEIGASSIYPRVSPSQANLMESPVTASVEQAGTPLFGRGVVGPYTAPRPAFGPGAGPGSLDRIVDLAFGGRGGAPTGGLGVRQAGRGGALTRSPGGEVVDELIVDPVVVREIFEASPEVVSAVRNAAGGLQTADLGALLSNPAFRVATGLAGLGMFGAGIAGMDSGNRTGETTAGSPPTIPGPTPANPQARLFAETDGTPLGEPPVAAAPPNPPAPGNIDPTAPAPVVTGGGLERESAVRAALAQNAPAAAAVQRATEPLSPERYRSIEDYYAARAAYAGSADKRRELMKFMEGQSSTLGPQLSAWAQQNPALAYEYQRRQLANPAANQQSSESITTTTVTSPIGTELPAAAAGNARATAEAAVNPNQGSFAMVDATRPQVQPSLQRVQDFIQRQAPRSAMYAGY